MSVTSLSFIPTLTCRLSPALNPFPCLLRDLDGNEKIPAAADASASRGLEKVGNFWTYMFTLFRVVADDRRLFGSRGDAREAEDGSVDSGCTTYGCCPV